MADPVVAPVAPPAAVVPPVAPPAPPAVASPSPPVAPVAVSPSPVAAPAAPVTVAAPEATPGGVTPGPDPVTPPVPDPAALKPAADPAKPPGSFLSDAKPDGPVDPAPPAITYEPFTLPEGQTLDPERLGVFTNLLAEAKAPQEFGQKLVDLYLGELSRLSEYQQQSWDRTQQEWLDAIRADPEIGGSRMETVAKTCGGVIERYGDKDLRDALALTGMGNHPAMVRFMNKVGTFLGEGKPVPAAKPAIAPQGSKGMRRYTTLNGANPPT